MGGGKGKCGFAKKEDDCFERFGTDEAMCESAGARCQWYRSENGKGKCALPRRPKDDKKEDGCYARFGTNEAACETAGERCQWYGDKGGKGKCALSDVESITGIAIAGAACFVRHHRGQKKRELRLASNAEQPPLEVN